MLRGAVMAALTLIVVASMSGCEIPGYVANVIVGPKKIPAVYEPVNRPIVVFVDDPADRLPSRELGNLLAGRIGEDLVAQGVIEQVIPPIMVERLKAANTDFAKWPVDKVGQQVGAQQVLYVLVQDCQITEDNLIYRPTIAVRVKMIDVETGARMFPAAASTLAADGQPVVHSTVYRDMAGATASTKAVLMRDLMESAAVTISKLFYKHPAPDAGDNLPG